MTILVERLILLYGPLSKISRRTTHLNGQCAQQNGWMAGLEVRCQRYAVASKLESASASVNAVKSRFHCNSSLVTAVIYVNGTLGSTLSLSLIVERQHGCEYGYSSQEHASLNIAVEWKHGSKSGTVLREYACS
jgi:hypothetical protein